LSIYSFQQGIALWTIFGQISFQCVCKASTHVISTSNNMHRDTFSGILFLHNREISFIKDLHLWKYHR